MRLQSRGQAELQASKGFTVPGRTPLWVHPLLDAGASLPCRHLHPAECLQDMLVVFPRVRGPESKQEPQAFYDLISEVTFRPVHYMLFLREESIVQPSLKGREGGPFL